MWATFVFLYVVSIILKSNNDLDGRANPWASHALAIDQRPVSMSAGAISNGLSIDFALLSPVPLHSFAGLPSAGSPDINLPGNKFCTKLYDFAMKGECYSGIILCLHQSD